MFPDQLFATIAKARAGLAVDVENSGMIVNEEESVGRVVRKNPEARFAGTDLLLDLAQLGDVLHDAELAQRPAGIVPRHVALAADGAHGAIGSHHAILHVVARTAAHKRGRSDLGNACAVLGMN